jgi:hypothetical protein
MVVLHKIRLLGRGGAVVTLHHPPYDHAHAHANFILPTTKPLPNLVANAGYDTLTMTTTTTTLVCNSRPL